MSDNDLRRLTIGELRDEYDRAARSPMTRRALRDELSRRRDGEGLVTSLAALEGRLLELVGADEDERRELRAVVLELNALLEHAGLPVPAVVDEYNPRTNWGAW
jgi:hypothetical protein